MTPAGRDRLRELLDAVLAEGNASLDAMAADAFASPFHFHRQLVAGAGEPPVALRRRVLLERASWQLGQGARVADVAQDAGYDSVPGFSRAFRRAFGRPPSSTTAGSDHRLVAPNGLHFHPPLHLWVDAAEQAGDGAPRDGAPRAGASVPLAQLVHHDLADTRQLLDAATALGEDELRRERRPGHVVLAWDGPEPSLLHVLDALVRTKEIWLASIAGEDLPVRALATLPGVRERHAALAPRWVATWRDVERRGAWADRLVDALCEPPESFPLSGVLVHVLTYAAHRRQVARSMLREAGREVDDGDPLAWLVDGAAGADAGAPG